MQVCTLCVLVCVQLFSNSSCFFSMCVEYKMSFSLCTASDVSHRRLDEISGESSISLVFPSGWWYSFYLIVFLEVIDLLICICWGICLLFLVLIFSECPIYCLLILSRLTCISMVFRSSVSLLFNALLKSELKLYI